MLDFEAAQAALLAAAAGPLRAESVRLHQALHRVLAAHVSASIDLPPADNSAMDGYAVRHADLTPGCTLTLSHSAFAGEAARRLSPGTAARIFTGGLLPEDADTVVIQEHCDLANDGVRIQRVPEQGANVRRRGEDVTRGVPLVRAGTRLGPADLALLAAQGLTSVPVWPRLKVAVLSTGNELRPAGSALMPGTIYDSNGPMLASALSQMGCDIVEVAHAPDELEVVATTLGRLAGQVDLVVSAGGVSVGDRDLVRPALQALGGELELWKVRMKPGKPVALGRVGGTPVLGLPGNPVSAYVVLAVLASPMIRRMQGREPVCPAVWSARLDSAQAHGDSRESFIRVQAEVREHEWWVAPHPQQSSGVLSSVAWASGVARIPAGEQRAHGERVTYYPFGLWLH